MRTATQFQTPGILWVSCLSAAGSYDWFVRTIAPDLAAEAESHGKKPFEYLDELAAATEPGAEGLFFLPYLSGERTPYADPDARGCFIGLTSRHQPRSHDTRRTRRCDLRYA